MKRKDIQVGMEVAVRQSQIASSKAIVLSLDPESVGVSPAFRRNDNGIAVAFSAYPQDPNAIWFPDVIQPQAIVGTWTDYCAKMQAKYAREDVAREQNQRLDAAAQALKARLIKTMPSKSSITTIACVPDAASSRGIVGTTTELRITGTPEELERWVAYLEAALR